METQAFHPIAREAATLMVMDGETATITTAGRSRLESSLSALFGDAELPWAVRSLLGMACHAEAAGHSGVAEALIRIASTARQALSSVDPNTASQVDATVRAFERFSGTRAKRAPVFGTESPQGSVALNSIMPRRRI